MILFCSCCSLNEILIESNKACRLYTVKDIAIGKLFF